MKKTGAFLLSMMLIFTLTVTNLAGAYHTAGRVCAAEETNDGADHSEAGTQGGENTGLSNGGLPAGDETWSGNQSTQVTPQQGFVPANTGDPQQ
ncbi:MAG: hypothetical protein IK016_01775 [Lachnospiraceae bacterium]|nr:hypothetical protein [Lachnospiraceae bacterium]